MKLSEIQKILGATFITGEDHISDEIFAGGGADLMDDILAATAKGSVLLTGLTTIEVIRTCNMTGVGAVVFVRGKKPDESLIYLAKLNNLPVLSTSHSLFVACGRLYLNGLRGMDGSW
ncbi:conserved hypothetical protein [Candidatus Magnetomoraceae bacterium gMMP-1]